MLKKLIAKIKKMVIPYDLRREGIAWVKENIGEEYVEEFCDKYDKINRGIAIGDMAETVVFLDMIETIKSETRY